MVRSFHSSSTLLGFWQPVAGKMFSFILKQPIVSEAPRERASPQFSPFSCTEKLSCSPVFFFFFLNLYVHCLHPAQDTNNDIRIKPRQKVAGEILNCIGVFSLTYVKMLVNHNDLIRVRCNRNPRMSIKAGKWTQQWCVEWSERRGTGMECRRCARKRSYRSELWA